MKYMLQMQVDLVELHYFSSRNLNIWFSDVKVKMFSDLCGATFYKCNCNFN